MGTLQGALLYADGTMEYTPAKQAAGKLGFRTPATYCAKGLTTFVNYPLKVGADPPLTVSPVNLLDQIAIYAPFIKVRCFTFVLFRRSR